jgi:hypothetical protein
LIACRNLLAEAEPSGRWFGDAGPTIEMAAPSAADP